MTTKVSNLSSLVTSSCTKSRSRLTSQRPAVKLSTIKANTLPTVCNTEPMVTASPLAMPATTESIIQPMVSSLIPAAIIVWPMSRRIRLRSISTLAMTGMAEMDMAVAMKSEKTSRWLLSASKKSGRNCPNKKPDKKVTVMPPNETPMAVRAWRRMSVKSVSNPVINSKNIAPMRLTTSSKYPCTAVWGTKKSPIRGTNPLNRDGPKIMPAKISPMTEGCPSLRAISPSPRAAKSKTAI